VISDGPEPQGSGEEPILITPDMLVQHAPPGPRAPRAPGGKVADGRIDFERGMRRIPPVIVLIIAVNVAVFAWEIALFLHGGFDHIIGNMIVLYIVGMAAEHAFGPARMLLVYFAGGLAGSTLSLLASPGPSVGASGAVFGVLAAVVVTLYRHQKHFYVRDKRIGIVLAGWAGYQLLTGFLTPFVDNFAHLGGIIGGALAALVLDSRLTAQIQNDGRYNDGR
jgi:membrane associated rhomboid family serine protease